MGAATACAQLPQACGAIRASKNGPAHLAAPAFISASTAFWLFVAFGLLVVWLRRSKHAAEAAGIGAIIGGAAANIADRLADGAVTDFLDFYIGSYHWPAFNVADSAITVGAVLLFLGGAKKADPEKA